MKIHTISFINSPECPLLDYIKQGIKTVEGRKNSQRYQDIKEGDIIIIKTKGENDVYVSVTYINKYKTIKEYLEMETLEKALPCAKTIEEGIKIYNQWSHPDERERLRQKFGYAFLGIGIKVISKEDFHNRHKYMKYKKKYLILKN